MPKLRVAIDGCGTLTSETILPHLMQPDFLDRATVEAVCDIVPERARAAAEKFDVPHWHGSLEEMLSGTDLDALLIIVPSEVHAEHACMALKAGKHIYVQKPMATSVETASEICGLVRETRLKAVAAPGQALWPMYDQIRDVIEQGEIGKPFWAQPPMMGWGGYEKDFPIDPSWFFSEDQGPFRDHGGYGLQSLVCLFGPVQRVTAFSGAAVPDRSWRGERFPVTGHDNTIALLDFGANTFGLLPESWCDSAPGARFLRVHGLSGAVQTDQEFFNYLDILPIGATVYRMHKDPLRLEVPLESVPFTQGMHPDLGHVHVYGDILHLVECIQEDRTPIASVERGMHFVEVVDAAFRSALTGVAQEVSPL